ncbi:response regulator transcription factor [Aestuariibius sp. 2305UL40-4]|uniref:response regulator transcription factor n=1 Tax=Aestuariibius violaceus TaxID=3234132 RepID=UPI00345E8AE6
MVSDPTEILIVDDDQAVAASLEALLQSWGYRTRIFQSGEDLLGCADPGGECLLLDVRLPGIDGLTVLEALRTRGDVIPVILMTGHGDIDMAVRAMRGGAQDFIEKPFHDKDLIDRIKTAVELVQPEAECRARLAKLTPREADVLREVVAGHPNKIIAHRLGISPKTVELHRARVMDKTMARNLSQLIRIALRAGVEVEDVP